MSPAPKTTTAGTRRPLRVPAAARASGPTALAALGVALVVGIVGMHGLASHGPRADPTAVSDTMSMTGATSAQRSAMPSGGSHEGHERSAKPHTANAATGTAADPGSGSSHDLAGMVMLCVVMLAAAALTLLVLLAVRTVRPLLPAAFHPAAAPARALQWVRGTGPPHVWAFSVIRC